MVRCGPRSMLGIRDEMLRLGERMMLCAEAGTPLHAMASKATSSGRAADRSFIREFASIRIIRV